MTMILGEPAVATQAHMLGRRRLRRGLQQAAGHVGERCGRLYPRIREDAKEITAPSAPACSVPSWRVAVGGKEKECAAVGMAWPATLGAGCAGQDC